MPDWRSLIANPRVQVGGVVGVGVLLALLGWFLHASALPPATPPTTQAPPAAAGTPPEGTATAAAPPATPPPEPPKTTAQITFTTNPSTNATVSWGKTRLGVITPKAPLVIVRPRDSGPLDVVVKAMGYLPVQTRAHTFADTRIVVRLTKPDATQTLVGYKAPIDGGIGLDGSTPEAIAPPPFP
ncbi:MAG TPA: hypothetical protein VFG30_42645 [Polyangiales bacterium]|nr:hypothetical protein [Polyangiales bacterium]